MKSERRHRLETNELAKRLSVWGDRIRPYSTLLTVGLVAAAVILLVTLFVMRRSASRRTAAWDAYTYAITSTTTDWDALEAAAEENPNTPMAELSNVTWADAELRLATELYLRDPAKAESHLENALKAYEQLREDSQETMIVNRATFGMARALEVDGNISKSRQLYEQVKGPFAELAQERAKELAEPKVQESIKWLATAEIPDVAAPIGPGTPGLRPPFGPEFSLDPEIPTRFPAGIPAGTDVGVPDALAPADARATDSSQARPTPELNFEDPFQTPSDPNRYSPPSGNDPLEDSPSNAVDNTNPPDPEDGDPPAVNGDSDREVGTEAVDQ